LWIFKPEDRDPRQRHAGLVHPGFTVEPLVQSGTRKPPGFWQSTFTERLLIYNPAQRVADSSGPALVAWAVLFPQKR
jgi:hypothetical protein